MLETNSSRRHGQPSHYTVLITCICACLVVASIRRHTLSSVPVYPTPSASYTTHTDHAKNTKSTESTTVYHTPDILREQGLRPRRTPDTIGPTAQQSLNDCFPYALVLQAQREEVPTPPATDIIAQSGKPYGTLRSPPYKKKALQARGYDMIRYRSSAQLLYHLHQGRAVLVSYPLPEQEIAHQVLAYSFDQKGIRVSDPLTGNQEHLARGQITQKNNPAFMKHPIGVRLRKRTDSLSSPTPQNKTIYSQTSQYTTTHTTT